MYRFKTVDTQPELTDNLAQITFRVNPRRSIRVIFNFIETSDLETKKVGTFTHFLFNTGRFFIKINFFRLEIILLFEIHNEEYPLLIILQFIVYPNADLPFCEKN